MSNNWYSIIIKGKRHGFFHSTRGLKQGDPLSPSLCILGAEVLSRQLNMLYQNHLYNGFHMDSRGPQINNLSSAEDIIIFTSTKRSSLQLIVNTIMGYEKVSDQHVNKEKSYYMVTANTKQETIDIIKSETGFNIKDSPIVYLGCLLYIGGQRIIYYFDLVEKIINRIACWQCKILNSRGKITLLKHVLQSIPIHTLSAIAPPKQPSSILKESLLTFSGVPIKRRRSIIGLLGNV